MSQTRRLYKTLNARDTFRSDERVPGRCCQRIPTLTKMNNESNFDQKSGDVPRRDFLKNTMLAAGVAAIFPFSLYGQNEMMNKYGLFGKLQAKAGQGEKLSELLMKDADT